MEWSAVLAVLPTIGPFGRTDRARRSRRSADAPYQDARHGPFDFNKELGAAPLWLQELVESRESLPWQRRGYLRQAMLDQLSNAAGFRPLEATPKPGGEEDGHG